MLFDKNESMIIIIKYTWTFFLREGGVVMSSQITHTQSSNIHPIANILVTCVLISSSCTLFSLPQPHHATASHPSPRGRITTGGRSERTRSQAKIARGTQSVTYAPELPSLSYLSRSLHSHSSVAERHLHTSHPA